MLQDVVERLEPLALFDSLELGVILGCDIPHLISSSPARLAPMYPVGLPLQSFYCSPVARPSPSNRAVPCTSCETI